MTTTDTNPTLDLDRLAVDLDRHDPQVVARYVDAVVDLARSRGLASPSLQVLTDPASTMVARDRALVMLTARLRAARRDEVLAPAA